MKKFEYNFKALGTICLIIIVKEKDDGLNKIINSCYNKIVSFEQEFSRFKKDSVLNNLNRLRKLEVSEDFLSLLTKSKKMYEFTNGYFNPLINIEKAGYSNSFDEGNFIKVKTKENIKFENIKIYGNLVELEENMSLDFGSIAKGFLSDKITKYLKSFRLENFLVNMGGDIYASGKNLEGKNWQVGITSPFEENSSIDVVELSNKSVSTSGIYLRKWKIGEKNYHHILNPYSQKQQTKILSVSIVDEFGYKTDAIATGVISMGFEKAKKFIKENNIKSLLVLDDGKIIKNIIC